MSKFSIDIKIFDLLSSDRPDDEKFLDELHDLLKDIDRINIREYFGSNHANIMVKLIKLNNRFIQNEKENLIDIGIESNLCKPADFALNYFKLIPPFVRQGTKIPANFKNLYAESRLCFAFGQYSAAIALSRAIIEIALRNRIGLSEESRRWTAGVILEKAREIKIVDINIAWISEKVIRTADNILHRARTATERECLNALDHTKEVLEYLFG
jgi:hypothetical protein